MMTFILGSIFVITLLVGMIAGWIIQAMFTAHINYVRHDYEELFQKNPHPELYDEEGNLDRGEYMHVDFEPGYDPDDFEPDDVTLQ